MATWIGLELGVMMPAVVLTILSIAMFPTTASLSISVANKARIGMAVGSSKVDEPNDASSSCSSTRGTVTILDQNDQYLVVSKPPSVVCHHSDSTGSRARMEVPMLQRTRQAVGRQVNLIHRLDRGSSGCLLLSFAEPGANSTTVLSNALAQKAQKTYIALVRGEGILRGRDFRKEGWFKVDRPIKNANGVLNNATTWFRFVAGQDNGSGTIDRPRASLVLARPETGRWHQIRRHLNGLSHPILGDSTHGATSVNTEWKRDRGMLPERTCLHLARIEMEPTSACPKGIDVTCPIALDLFTMLENHLPAVLEQAEPLLREEGIFLRGKGLEGAMEQPYELETVGSDE